METEGQFVSWGTFKAKFIDKYFLADLKRKKEMEFLKLEQGNMSVGEYAVKFEELARFCPYSELDGRSKCSKFESGLRSKLKIMFGHQEIADFATLVNKCRIYEDNLKADELATPETISPRNYGPQRNHMRERGKERVEDDRKPYAATTRHRDRNFQRSRPLTVPTEGVSTPMCNKCGRLHFGTTCPGSGNKCFHCKEFGHIKRFCPKLDQRPNVIHAEKAKDHGRKVTPSGAGTSGVDDPARGKLHGGRIWVLTNGKQAKCVITDGDLSMKNAIKRVFPEAHHRLCAWHICNNAEKNIKKNNFHKDFQKVMYVNVEIDDFNMMWEELIAKHELHNNAWATHIF
ncbi:hypothetical protein Lal_00024331 [Lupinus albus]|nr:hypothetical protein Lal_00024331 [Lupinus albus]